MNLVDEQPVGRNMAFAVIGPVVAERVVAVCGRKGFAIGEFGDDRMKPFDRHMPPLRVGEGQVRQDKLG